MLNKNAMVKKLVEKKQPITQIKRHHYQFG